MSSEEWKVGEGSRWGETQQKPEKWKVESGKWKVIKFTLFIYYSV